MVMAPRPQDAALAYGDQPELANCLPRTTSRRGNRQAAHRCAKRARRARRARFGENGQHVSCRLSMGRGSLAIPPRQRHRPHHLRRRRLHPTEHRERNSASFQMPGRRQLTQEDFGSGEQPTGQGIHRPRLEARMAPNDHGGLCAGRDCFAFSR